jgi:hypothetical protein
MGTIRILNMKRRKAMPWQVKAEGHALTEAGEKRLFRLLGRVLGEESAGTVMPVVFTGDHVQGNPMSEQDLALAGKDTVTEEEDAEEPEEEPEAKLVPSGEEYPTQTVSYDPAPESSASEGSTS